MRIAIVTLTLASTALFIACGGSDASKTATPTTSSATTATRPALTATPIAASATPAVAASATPAPATPQPPAATEPAPLQTTAPPPPAPTEAPPPPPPSGGSATLTIAAVDVLFDTASLSAPAGPITIIFNNDDTAIAHNIQFFAGSQSIGMTEIKTGPATDTLSLGTLAPGSYFYKCDVHPTTMKGSLKVS